MAHKGGRGSGPLWTGTCRCGFTRSKENPKPEADGTDKTAFGVSGRVGGCCHLHHHLSNAPLLVRLLLQMLFDALRPIVMRLSSSSRVYRWILICFAGRILLCLYSDEAPLIFGALAVALSSFPEAHLLWTRRRSAYSQYTLLPAVARAYTQSMRRAVANASPKLLVVSNIRLVAAIIESTHLRLSASCCASLCFCLSPRLSFCLTPRRYRAGSSSLCLACLLLTAMLVAFVSWRLFY